MSSSPARGKGVLQENNNVKRHPVLSKTTWLLLFAAVFVSAELVCAHALVIDSVPSRGAVLPNAPENVTLRFNAKIELALTRVVLKLREGKEVPLEVSKDSTPDRLVIPLPPLVPGIYIIQYRVLATDGHLTEGTLHFTILGH